MVLFTTFGVISEPTVILSSEGKILISFLQILGVQGICMILCAKNTKIYPVLISPLPDNRVKSLPMTLQTMETIKTGQNINHVTMPHINIENYL